MIWREFMVDPKNIPLALPGVYSITHLDTGRRYIGISGNVLKRLAHRAKHPGSGRIGEAIRALGPAAFLLEPLYYSLNGASGLPAIEADMIADFDSMTNGFNVQRRSDRAGDRGPLFAAAIRDGLRSPDVQETIRKRSANPEFRQKLSAGVRRALRDPAMMAALVERVARLRGDPEIQARRIEGSTAAWANPAVRARRCSIMRQVNSRQEKRKRA